GLLTERFSVERMASLAPDDWRRKSPEFQPPRIEKNLALRDALRPIAKKHGVETGAVAIDWTLAWPGGSGAIRGARRPEQGAGVGARSPEQVDGWVPAANLTLDGEDLDAIAAALERTGAGTGPARP